MTFHFQSLSEGSVTVAPYQVTEPINTLAESLIRKIVLEGDVNVWLRRHAIRAPYIADGTGDDAAGTIIDPLGPLGTQSGAITAAVKALKEAWGGTGAYGTAGAYSTVVPDETTQSDYVLQLESDITNPAGTTIPGEPLYKAVEEALNNLFQNKTNTTETADSSVVATDTNLNWKHNKVAAWTAMQTADYGTNGGTGDGSASWFSETLADKIFTDTQLVEILDTVASHGQRIIGVDTDADSKFEYVEYLFEENDEISASVNVIDGRTIGTGTNSLPNKHQWQFVLRQKTENSPFTGRGGAPRTYKSFGHTGTFLAV